MNRTYAAKRLLEHGPLSGHEFREITGWGARAAERTLQQLLETGIVIFRNQWTQAHKRSLHSKVRVYALATD